MSGSNEIENDPWNCSTIESKEDFLEEKIVHILDEMEEVEEDFNFDIEDEIS